MPTRKKLTPRPPYVGALLRMAHHRVRAQLNEDIRSAGFTDLQDVFKESAQGKFMINIHGRSATPLGTIFQTFYSTQPGEANESRFKSKDYDRALDAFFVADSDAARQKAASTMTEILQTYAPVMPLLYDVENAFVQPWLMGYHPSRVAAHWQYMDIAPSKTP